LSADDWFPTSQKSDKSQCSTKNNPAIHIMVVPTIHQLINKIDRFNHEDKDKNVNKDYKETLLRDPMKVFGEFVSKLIEDWR